ncbi:MAG: hypothetical protein AAF563_22515 [Pseudomonadota bacterium]
MHRVYAGIQGPQTRRRILRTFGAGSALATIGAASPFDLATKQQSFVVRRNVAQAGGDACTGGALPAEISGHFDDTFGHRHEIGAAHWMSFHDDEEFLYRICTVYRQDGYLIAQNDAVQAYYPDMYSRFEWVIDGDDIWYCQQVFAADSHDEARDFDRHPRADSSNPGTGGCGVDGSIAWTKLSAAST